MDLKLKENMETPLSNKQKSNHNKTPKTIAKINAKKCENIKQKRATIKKSKLPKRKSKYIDEDNLQKSIIIKKLFEKYINQTVSIFLEKQIFPNIKKNNCNGCRIDHPSQKQHDCLMWPNEDWWDIYVLDALKLLDFSIIYALARNRLYEHFSKKDVDNIELVYKDLCQYIEDDEWVNQMKKDFILGK